jgi:hypothetical protein
LTIQSGESDLPASGDFEIVSLEPWYPLVDTVDSERGMSMYMMDEQSLFWVYVASNIPVRGQAS